MRILTAVDENPYSAYVVREVARLAMNTWADLTLLGISHKIPKRGPGTGLLSWQGLSYHPLVGALQNYREDFLRYFDEQQVESPYAKEERGYELVEIKRGLWEELYICRGSKKDLKVRLRSGNPSREILAESREEESDLIVIGCPKNTKCEWETASHVPQRVVSEASCSVLVVKEEKRPRKIVCCLDHDNVSQESLEMINQMATLQEAELEIVGVTDSEGLKEKVDRKMNQILRYYTAQKIKSWIKVVDVKSLDTFISEAAQKDLIALWMGKRSLLKKLFSPQRVRRLVHGTQSSILILR